MGHILICDDEPNIVESLVYIVKKKGFAVSVARDGKQAFEVATQQKPDVIFLDVGMPELDGLQVCAKLREHPNTKFTYIVVLTAHGQHSDENLARSAGANEFLTKPFSPRVISQKVEQIFSSLVRNNG